MAGMHHQLEFLKSTIRQAFDAALGRLRQHVGVGVAAKHGCGSAALPCHDKTTSSVLMRSSGPRSSGDTLIGLGMAKSSFIRQCEAAFANLAYGC